MSSSVGRISQVDPSTLLKLQAGCNYINAEVKRLRARVTSVTILCVVGGLAAWAILAHNGMNDPRLPLGAAFVIASLVYAQARRELAKSYKGIVVSRVVGALGHGLTYAPQSSLTKQDFLSMDLFEKRAEQWHAEDEVCGKQNAVSYSIHEAKATRTEGSGKSRRTVTIFKGVIVRLDFNKYFQGHTVVVPDSESKILGGLFGESESRRAKQIVRMENPAFENTYSVYATDDQQARYLLTPKMMELVMEAQMTLRTQIRLCFLEHSVFITIPQDRDRFEVSMFGSEITPTSAVGDLVDVVNLAERLVDTLELETRIWTRV